MFSSELWSVLKQVVSSWQIIAMVVAIILYWSLVNAAASLQKKTKPRTAAKIQKLKRPPKSPKLDKNLDASGLGIGE
jgi:phosphate/sulfate permease